MTSYNKVVIDLSALQANFRAIQEAVGLGVGVLAMVKSDAYGHGLIRSAQALAQVGATHFGVAEIDEGIALRDAGVDGDIVVFLGWDGADELIDHRLTPVVFDLGVVQRLSAQAVARHARIGVQLKVDVGMGRFGILPVEVADFVAALRDLPGIYLAGILSHFPMADSNGVLTRTQNQTFMQMLADLKGQPGLVAGQKVPVHIANSAAVMDCPEAHHDLVRPGIALYGGYPSDGAACRSCCSLTPVMSFYTRVLQLKDVPAGYGVSYGHLHVTSRPARLAVLPVGYADGYLRSLTGHAQVLVRGQRAQVCGRICMNACVVDVSAISGVAVGDEVVLLGRQEGPSGVVEINADEIAGWMNTIHYEVMCLFGNNNQREYVGGMSEDRTAG